MKSLKIILIIFVLALVSVAPAAAQTGENDPADFPTVTVSGEIINATEGAETPGNVEIMLHILDAEFNERDMIHGESDADGRFLFEEVAYEPGLLYAVMAVYQDATYFSMPSEIAEGEEALAVEVSVFETTTDTSLAQVDAMHIFFDIDQGGLMVGEVYSLSNLGDKTVAGAAFLDDGTTPATFRFKLPQDAASVNFQGSQNRYFITEDGFADTEPLLPGQGSGQVIVSYVMPYEDEIVINRPVNLPTANVNILVPPDLGVTLDSSGMIDNGRRDMGQGITVDMYSLTDLQPGDEIRLDLSGTLQMPTSDVMPGERTTDNTLSLAIGGVLLGLTTIGVGIWWYRRAAENEALLEDEEFSPEFEDIVEQIAQLDAAHDQNEIDDDSYQLQRSNLRELAKAAMARSGD